MKPTCKTCKDIHICWIVHHRGIAILTQNEFACNNHQDFNKRDDLMKEAREAMQRLKELFIQREKLTEKLKNTLPENCLHCKYSSKQTGEKWMRCLYQVSLKADNYGPCDFVNEITNPLIIHQHCRLKRFWEENK